MCEEPVMEGFRRELESILAEVSIASLTHGHGDLDPATHPQSYWAELLPFTSKSILGSCWAWEAGVRMNLSPPSVSRLGQDRWRSLRTQGGRSRKEKAQGWGFWLAWVWKGRSLILGGSQEEEDPVQPWCLENMAAP